MSKYKKLYVGAKQEIPNTPLDKLVPSARFTLGSQKHSIQIEERRFKRATLTCVIHMR